MQVVKLKIVNMWQTCEQGRFSESWNSSAVYVAAIVTLNTKMFKHTCALTLECVVQSVHFISRYSLVIKIKINIIIYSTSPSLLAGLLVRLNTTSTALPGICLVNHMFITWLTNVTNFHTTIFFLHPLWLVQ